MALRKALRLSGVKQAIGWSTPTIYRKMAEGRFPQSHRMDPDGQAVIWWQDEVEAWQEGKWQPSISPLPVGEAS
jgi:predicted DNA-binding transcriptional regulator AlpA